MSQIAGCCCSGTPGEAGCSADPVIAVCGEAEFPFWHGTDGPLTCAIYPTPGRGMPTSVYPTSGAFAALQWNEWWPAWWHGIPAAAILQATVNVHLTYRRVIAGCEGETVSALEAPITGHGCNGSNLPVSIEHGLAETVVDTQWALTARQLSLAGVRGDQAYTSDPIHTEVWPGPHPSWVQDVTGADQRVMWPDRRQYIAPRWHSTVAVTRPTLIEPAFACNGTENTITTDLNCGALAKVQAGVRIDYPMVYLPDADFAGCSAPGCALVGATDPAYGLEVCMPTLAEQFAALDFPSAGIESDEGGENRMFVGLTTDASGSGGSTAALRIMLGGNGRVDYGSVQRFGAVDSPLTASGTLTHSRVRGDGSRDSWTITVSITMQAEGWCVADAECGCFQSYTESGECPTSYAVTLNLTAGGPNSVIGDTACTSAICGGDCTMPEITSTVALGLAPWDGAIGASGANFFVGDGPWPWEALTASRPWGRHGGSNNQSWRQYWMHETPSASWVFTMPDTLCVMQACDGGAVDDCVASTISPEPINTQIAYPYMSCGVCRAEDLDAVTAQIPASCLPGCAPGGVIGLGCSSGDPANPTCIVWEWDHTLSCCPQGGELTGDITGTATLS